MQEIRDAKPLSEREREILLLAAEGLTDKEIASRLDVALGTVGTYWERLRLKLNASNKAEAIAKALATEHREALHKLKDTTEWMELLMNAADEYAIFMTDDQGKIMTWNIGVARVLDYAEDDFVGRNIGDLFLPADVEANAPEEERKRALEHGRSLDDRWHRRGDGTDIWVRGLLYRLTNGDGRVRYAKIMRDATTERQMHDELDNMRKALDAARKS